MPRVGGLKVCYERIADVSIPRLTHERKVIIGYFLEGNAYEVSGGNYTFMLERNFEKCNLDKHS